MQSRYYEDGRRKAVAAGLVGRVVIGGEGAGIETRGLSRRGLVGLIDSLSIQRNDQTRKLKDMPFE